MSALSDFVGGSAPLWVTGSTYSIGKIVISPADFSGYIRKTAGAGATDPSADATNWQPFGERAIKLIQRGTVAGTVTSVTITAVNMAKAELRNLGGAFFDSGGVFKTAPRFVLTNATTISVNGDAAYVSGGGAWELTERY